MHDVNEEFVRTKSMLKKRDHQRKRVKMLQVQAPAVPQPPQPAPPECCGPGPSLKSLARANLTAVVGVTRPCTPRGPQTGCACLTPHDRPALGHPEGAHPRWGARIPPNVLMMACRLTRSGLGRGPESTQWGVLLPAGGLLHAVCCLHLLRVACCLLHTACHAVLVACCWLFVALPLRLS